MDGTRACAYNPYLSTYRSGVCNVEHALNHRSHACPLPRSRACSVWGRECRRRVWLGVRLHADWTGRRHHGSGRLPQHSRRLLLRSVQYARVDRWLPERLHLRRLPERPEHELHPHLHESERLPQRLQLQRDYWHEHQGLPVAAGWREAAVLDRHLKAATVMNQTD